jgi:hypothetical protein
MIRVICAAPTAHDLLAIRERVLATVRYEIEPA